MKAKYITDLINTADEEPEENSSAKDISATKEAKQQLTNLQKAFSDVSQNPNIPLLLKEGFNKSAELYQMIKRNTAFLTDLRKEYEL